MLTSTDIIPATNPLNVSIEGRSDGIFQLPGSADGAGLLRDGDGFIYVVNNEDSYSVSRIRLDANLRPISGDFLLTSEVADFARQCSATMWEQEIHGGDRDVFLSASEAFNLDVKAIDPRVAVPTPTADFAVPEFGKFEWENATPLPQGAYNGQTVIIGGDDDSGADTALGQVVMYHSTESDMDFENGDVYVLRLLEVADRSAGAVDGATINAEAGATFTEEDIDFGVTYNVEFVRIDDAANLTFEETAQACLDVNASQFMRVEDVDYQKGTDENGRNVFFAVTGRGPGRDTFNDWGTIYRLNLDADSPLTGTLTQIISGNTDTNNQDGNLSLLQSPDNITVTENYVYTQEDPNSDARNHTAYIYQSDLDGNNIQPVMEFIIDSNVAPDDVEIRDAEYGALIDVSDKVGEPDTFLLALQPHYWTDARFSQLDGHEITESDCADFGGIGFCREDNQASQIVILRGLPR